MPASHTRWQKGSYKEYVNMFFGPYQSVWPKTKLASTVPVPSGGGSVSNGVSGNLIMTQVKTLKCVSQPILL